jgi:ribosomal protein S7
LYDVIEKFINNFLVSLKKVKAEAILCGLYAPVDYKEAVSKSICVNREYLYAMVLQH